MAALNGEVWFKSIADCHGMRQHQTRLCRQAIRAPENCRRAMLHLAATCVSRWTQCPTTRQAYLAAVSVSRTEHPHSGVLLYVWRGHRCSRSHRLSALPAECSTHLRQHRAAGLPVKVRCDPRHRTDLLDATRIRSGLSVLATPTPTHSLSLSAQLMHRATPGVFWRKACRKEPSQGGGTGLRAQ